MFNGYGVGFPKECTDVDFFVCCTEWLDFLKVFNTFRMIWTDMKQSYASGMLVSIVGIHVDRFHGFHQSGYFVVSGNSVG